MSGCVKKETCNCSEYFTKAKQTFTGTPSEVSAFENRLYIDSEDNWVLYNNYGNVEYHKEQWTCVRE